MINSGEIQSDDRVHLTSDEVLEPLPQSRPRMPNQTNTDVLLQQLVSTNKRNNLIKKIRGIRSPEVSPHFNTMI